MGLISVEKIKDGSHTRVVFAWAFKLETHHYFNTKVEGHIKSESHYVEWAF